MKQTVIDIHVLVVIEHEDSISGSELYTMIDTAKDANKLKQAIDNESLMQDDRVVDFYKTVAMYDYTTGDL
jgi:hypothetical protein